MENLAVPSSGWLELKQINTLVTEEVFHSAPGGCGEYMHIILCVRLKFFENGMQSLFASLEISGYFKQNFADAEIDFRTFLFLFVCFLLCFLVSCLLFGLEAAFFTRFHEVASLLTSCPTGTEVEQSLCSIQGLLSLPEEGITSRYLSRPSLS